MKRPLQFATKLNFRDIQKYNCFWVPSYDLFASARKVVFPTPTVTGVHRLRLLYQAQEGDAPRVHPLRVEFKYTVRGQGIITCQYASVAKIWVQKKLEPDRAWLDSRLFHVGVEGPK